MMKRAYNPTGCKSKALAMAEDALDDADQFETTEGGKALHKMVNSAGWIDAEDLVDNIFFRCDLNQRLAMFVQMNVVRLAPQVQANPLLMQQLVQVLPQQIGRDIEGLFCGLACVFPWVSSANNNKMGASALIMLTIVTQFWSQIRPPLEVEGVATFFRLLDAHWVTASELYIEEAAATPKNAAKGKEGEEIPLVEVVKEQIFKDEVINNILKDFYNPTDATGNAKTAVLKAKKATM